MFTTIHKINEPLYDRGISGWFQLSDCNQFAFSNAKEKDVIIRTTTEAQNILIGQSISDENNASTLTVKRNEIEVYGNINLHGNFVTETDYLFFDAKIVSSNMQATYFDTHELTSDSATMNEVSLSNLYANGQMIINDQGQVEGGRIRPSTLSTDKIIDEAITDQKIKALTLTTSSFSNASITTAKIRDANVTTDKINDQAITTEKYRDLSITNDKITDSSVSTRILQDGLITTPKITNDAITSEKLHPDLNLRGDVNVRGLLMINTTRESNGTIPADVSLDVYQKMTLVDENDARTFVQSKNGYLGIMQSDPAFTLDVWGDIRISSNIYINEDEYLGFWLARNGSDVSFDHGYVGIHTHTPRSELDVHGDITLTSNVIFSNDTGDTYISTSGSNLGIRGQNPVATLDVNGNLAIQNEILSDENRNLFSRKSIISENLWVKTENSDFELDVNGNASFAAENFYFNRFHFYMNSVGTLGLSGTEYSYYRIATLRARNDALNSGGLVIEGYIGDIHRTNNMHVRILIGSRDTDTDDQRLNVTVTQGDSPSKMVGYCDLELYKEKSDVAPRYYIYLKTRAKSSFSLNLYGGEVVQNFNTDWRNSRLSERPDKISDLNVRIIKSLIDCPMGNHKEFYGDQYIGGNVYIKGGFVMEAGKTLTVREDIISQNGNLSVASNIESLHGHLDVDSNIVTQNGDILAPRGKLSVKGDITSEDGNFSARGISMQGQHLDILGRMTLAGTFSNQGDIWTGAHIIRAESESKTRSSFDLFRSFDKKGVQLTVNGTYNEDDGNWYNTNGGMGVAQLNILTSESKNGDNTGFYFNTIKAPLFEEGNPLVFDNWMTLRNAKMGINDVSDPKETLEMNGNLLMHGGGIMIRDTYITGEATEKLHYQAMHTDMIQGERYSMRCGKDDSMDENSAMNISYQYNSVEDGNNRIDIGFMKDRNVMTITDGRKVSLNTGQIESDITYKGNVKGNDSFIYLTNVGTQTHRVIGFARLFENVTTGASTWEKLATFSPKDINGENRNQGAVIFQGVVTSKTNTNSFTVNMYFDASNDVSNRVMVYSKQANDTFFNSELDLCMIYDDQLRVHIYMVSYTKDACLNMDIHYAQNEGAGIHSYEDTSFTVEVNPVNTEEEYKRFVTENDSEINRVNRLITTRFNGKFYVFTSEGNVGIGNTYPGARLDIDGQARMDTIFLRDSRLEMPLLNGLFVNDTLYFDTDNFLVQDRIKDAFVLPRHLSDATKDAFWDVTLSNLAANQVFIDTSHDRIGIFNENPTFGVDIAKPVTLRNSEADNEGFVRLNSSACNGLGINMGEQGPICALDVNGDINFSGQVLFRGAPWRTSPWTFCNDEQHLVCRSNVIIADTIFANDTERLCVESNIGLSNAHGKSVLHALSNNLGINTDHPLHTVDIGGTFGIDGHQIYDSNGVMVRSLISTQVLTVSESNIGVYNGTPGHTLDIDGDINITGRIYRHGKKYNDYLNQWEGSNAGISYMSNVGIGTRIPYDETLSVLHAMSLSNTNGERVKLFLEDDDAVLNVSQPMQTKAVSFSNDDGYIMLKSQGCNLGVNMSIFEQMHQPQYTLDVAGDIGVNGTRIIRSDHHLENIAALEADAMRITTSNVGIHTRYPRESLTINGTLGIDNGHAADEQEKSSAVFRIDTDAYLALDASAFVTSRFIARPSVQEIGLHIQTQGDQADGRAPALFMEGAAVYGQMKTTAPHHATFLQFENSADEKKAFIGLDGSGLNGAEEDTRDALTISNKESIRFMTNDNKTEQMRIDSQGNVGVNIVYPEYTLDVGGTGIGIMGSLLVDNEKNITSTHLSNAEATRTKVLDAGVNTRYDYAKSTIQCKFVESGVYSVTKESPGFETLSNVVNGNPRGSVYAYFRDDVFLVATDSVGTSIYENFAFQNIQGGREIPLNSNITLDLFARKEDASYLNHIGNTAIIGSYMEVINPTSHDESSSAFASVRARNWNPMIIDASASQTDSNYVEIKTSDDVSRLNSDKDIQLCIDDLSYVELHKEAGRVFIPGGRQLGMNLLQSDGMKQVFADADGNLTMSMSDERLKTDIHTLPYGLEQINKLNPVSFYWNDEERKKRGAKREIGLIAQQVQPIIPECVGENTDGEHNLYLDYYKMIPVLIKSVQELSAENANIKKILAGYNFSL